MVTGVQRENLQRGGSPRPCFTASKLHLLMDENMEKIVGGLPLKMPKMTAKSIKDINIYITYYI